MGKLYRCQPPAFRLNTIKTFNPSELSLSMERIAFQKVSEHAKKPLTFSPDATASELIGALRKSGLFEALITSGSKPRIVTLIDLLRISDPERASIGRLSKPAYPVSGSAPILEAVDLMVTNRVWGLAVVEGGAVSGLITQLEVARSLARSEVLQGIRCREVMNPRPPFVEAGDRLSKARSIMRRGNLAYLPVLRNGMIVGGISAGELVFNMIQPRRGVRRGFRGGGGSSVWSIPIEGVMDRSPILAGEEEPVSEALKKMLRRGGASCLVARDGRLVGMVGLREAISPLLRITPEARPRIYVIGLPEAEVEEPLQPGIVEKKLERAINRAYKRFKPIVEVVIDVKRRRSGGGRTLYTVKARIYAPGRPLTASAEGWQLAEAFDKLCRRIDRLRARKARPASRHAFPERGEPA